MTTKRESKRILSVKIKRTQDSDADTSYLGEFSDDPKQYAIVAIGEAEGLFYDSLPCDSCGKLEAEHTEADCVFESDVASDYEHECVNDDPQHCHEYEKPVINRSREYRFFNPCAENYTGAGTEEEIEKYCLQDYDRMRNLNRGEWYFLGIRAEAEVQLTGNLCQTISSGGLWGIESDSDSDYFKEVEGEQLDELKAELHAIGFSKRAIAAAFRDVKRSDD